MKLKPLGFRKKKVIYSKPPSESDDHLPEKDQTPPWLHYFHLADEIADEFWRNARMSSGVTK